MKDFNKAANGINVPNIIINIYLYTCGKACLIVVGYGRAS